MKELLRRLDAHTEARRSQFGEDFAPFARLHNLTGWEGWFSPYPLETYEAVLTHVAPRDVVLEIGAGDLRLALRMAQRAARVYAVEVNPVVVGSALETIGLHMPRHLNVVCANALDFSFPPGITVAVLLMRHCRHFGTYFDRLQAVGCRRLLTNARWKSGLEVIDLQAPRLPLEQVIQTYDGWYACRCGAVGYVGLGDRAGDPPLEVSACPDCSSSAPYEMEISTG
ncbi:MAG: rRNA adenine methyltransferase [Chloroflexi bacterium]|nr:MAG: rRNA adenine methyltransferase [Chloroflexota bacterium]